MLLNEVMIKLNCLADPINKRVETDFARERSFSHVSSIFTMVLKFNKIFIRKTEKISRSFISNLPFPSYRCSGTTFLYGTS